MEKHIIWKKKFFNNTYQLFAEDAGVGFLSVNPWRDRAQGEYGKCKAQFIAKGLFHRPIHIFDLVSGNEVGTVKYFFWRRKGIISMADGSEFGFRYQGIFYSRWVIFDSNGILLRFSRGFFGGNIVSETKNDLLILTGLYLHHYLMAKFRKKM